MKMNASHNYVLVTGGAGYIGAHTCKALFKEGFCPVVFDNLDQGHREFVRWGPFEEGDIGDAPRLDEIMRKYAFQAVIHFAAHAYVGESVGNPAKYYHNNVKGSLVLLDAMRDNNINKMVFSSSCSVYGHAAKLPIAEDHPKQPINPYGTSKLMVEKILQDYDFAYGLKSICLRYFNAAGADPDGELGEDHAPETHLIPLVMKAAANSQPIEIYGNDYDTPDGTCVRDYVHVSDLADAHVKALLWLKDNGTSNRFNLGLNHGYSVLDVINAVKECTSLTFGHKICQRRNGDPAILVSDSKRSTNMLGWSPRFRDIHPMIEHAWKWHTGRFN